MRLIALCVLVGWLTLSANAQIRDGEDRCDASNFACRAEVLQALKSCEQNYQIGGDWLNPTYNDLRCRHLWEKWFEDLLRLAAHPNEQDRNRKREHGAAARCVVEMKRVGEPRAMQFSDSVAHHMNGWHDAVTFYGDPSIHYI